MLKNISMRVKLLFFPFMFILIVIASGAVYGYFSNYANSRSEVATKTEGFLKDLLKGRISVYQFLRSPTEDNKQKTIAIFESLNKKLNFRT